MLPHDSLPVELLDDGWLDATEFRACCRIAQNRLRELIDSGLLEPIGEEPAAWRFRRRDVPRVRIAERLERDLGVNPSGAAVILDLLIERDRLAARVRVLEGMVGD